MRGGEPGGVRWGRVGGTLERSHWPLGGRRRSGLCRMVVLHVQDGMRGHVRITWVKDDEWTPDLRNCRTRPAGGPSSVPGRRRPRLRKVRRDMTDAYGGSRPPDGRSDNRGRVAACGNRTGPGRQRAEAPRNAAACRLIDDSSAAGAGERAVRRRRSPGGRPDAGPQRQGPGPGENHPAPPRPPAVSRSAGGPIPRSGSGRRSRVWRAGAPRGSRRCAGRSTA